MAEEAYDRTSNCSFTTFIGYEHTGPPNNNNYHRNVIFRNERVPKHAISYIETPTDIDLWEQLTVQCIESIEGCDVLAIPHNSNLSSGAMFPSFASRFETPETARNMAEMRNAMEPIMEVFQHKGNSECFNGLPDILGDPDELCEHEQVRQVGREALSVFGDRTIVRFCEEDEIGEIGFGRVGSISKNDFFRSVLLTGLQDQAIIGLNSYKFVVIASTDAHTSRAGATTELHWHGHLVAEGDFETRLTGRPNLQGSPFGLTANPGGLAGVWAVENSRDAIFEAMRCREVFGTTGTRIQPRLFAGWNFADNACAMEDKSAYGYENGVPMGSPSTIYGNWRRGTGILNNDLCIGRLVWNRQHFVKDPATGRRQARPNPESEWIIEEVPNLRIVPQALWDEVKARQKATRRTIVDDGSKGVRSERAKRPIYLFSGLLMCGDCGGSYTRINATSYGCTNRKTRGTCDNNLTIKRTSLEEIILSGLKDKLMDPALVKEFIRSYHEEIIQHQANESSRRDRLLARLAKVEKELDALITAVKSGINSETLKAEFERLEQEKLGVEEELKTEPPPPIRLHPNLADVYRQKVDQLTDSLNGEDTRQEAGEIIRALIDEIKLVPVDGERRVHLKGELAEMLALSTNKKPGSNGTGLKTTLIAGACNRHYSLLDYVSTRDQSHELDRSSGFKVSVPWAPSY